MTKKQEIAFTPQMFIDRTIEEISFCEAKLHELNSNLDKELFSARQKYADLLSSYQETKELATQKLHQFALENPSIFPSNKKSISSRFGSFGFRIGKPHFVLVNDATWETVLDYLDDHLPDYVRMKYEPAKDKLLADRKLPLVAELLPKMGLVVAQSETFYIDLTKSKV